VESTALLFVEHCLEKELVFLNCVEAFMGLMK